MNPGRNGTNKKKTRLGGFLEQLKYNESQVRSQYFIRIAGNK
jgi:hypothetical protein